MTTETLKRPFTLGEFRVMNEYIYGEKNREFYSDGDLVRILFEVTSLLGKVARKDRRDLFELHVADVFSWYNALANRLDLDVQEAMWLKFPSMCSYCLKDPTKDPEDPERCACGIDHPPEPVERDKVLRASIRDRKGREPQMLSDHQHFHRLLYAWKHEGEDPAKIVQHIEEEIGEVSKALRYKDMENVAEEMADVLAWLLTFCNRFGLKLAVLMWGFYPYECRKCAEAPCMCEEKV